MQNFKSALNLNSSASSEWLDFRNTNWQLALEKGLPTNKNEKWKYNKLNLFKRDFVGAEQNSSKNLLDLLSGLDRQTCDKIIELKHSAFSTLVFVNGFLDANLSSLAPQLRINSTIPNMQKSVLKNQNYPSLRLVDEQNRLENLHLALLQNNYRIDINHNFDAPLLILQLNSGSENQAISSSYELNLAENVTAEVIELQLGTNASLNLVLNNIVLQKNAALRMQLYNSTDLYSGYHGLTYVKQAENSNFNLRHLNLSQGWSRQDTLVDISDINAKCDASGIFFGKDKAELDLHFIARHLASSTTSKQLYKFILDDRAQGVFNTGVFVQRDSQKVDSMQRSANLLISDKARMNAKPELEIYADNVKCAHGASTGSLDEQILFALRSRGISRLDAINMMTMAFANQVLDELDNPVMRSLAQNKIFKHLTENSETKLDDF